MPLYVHRSIFITAGSRTDRLLHAPINMFEGRHLFTGSCHEACSHPEPIKAAMQTHVTLKDGQHPHRHPLPVTRLQVGSGQERMRGVKMSASRCRWDGDAL